MAGQDSQVTRQVFDNGLTVLLKEIHTAPVISWWVLYRVGSRNERTGQTGVSHWVEHMLFKGTEKFPAGVLDKAVDRDGGIWNAQTSFDYTAFFETMPASRIGLAVAHRRESQDLCFVQGDYRAFLATRGADGPPGPILDREGNALGTHNGLTGFTLGQRKGLRLPAREALYVLEKDMDRNALIVGARQDVGREEFAVEQVNWIAGAPPADVFDAQVQVRYHAPRIAGRVTCGTPTQARVRLITRQPDVAPGQSAVFYVDDTCLGGGIITL